MKNFIIQENELALLMNALAGIEYPTTKTLSDLHNHVLGKELHQLPKTPPAEYTGLSHHEAKHLISLFPPIFNDITIETTTGTMRIEDLEMEVDYSLRIGTLQGILIPRTICATTREYLKLPDNIDQIILEYSIPEETWVPATGQFEVQAPKSLGEPSSIIYMP